VIPTRPPDRARQSSVTTDLLREMEQPHRTRHETFLHGSESALKHHTQRTAALEEEYLRRTPDRDVDEERLRSGRRDNA
jgi:hypothetical protein